MKETTPASIEQPLELTSSETVTAKPLVESAAGLYRALPTVACAGGVDPKVTVWAPMTALMLEAGDATVMGIATASVVVRAPEFESLKYCAP
jgi:hypothetical protein